MSNTAHCFLDLRYKSKTNSSYNVKLCVYINGERKHYRTNFKFTKNEWAKLNNKGLKDPNLLFERDAIREIETIACKILKQLLVHSFEAFEYAYYNNVENGHSDPFVSVWFDQYVAHLESMSRSYTYCEHLITSRNSFLSFKKKLKFSHVTPEFLEKYRAWMESEKQKDATNQSYLRDLRTVFNFAIKKKVIHNDRYPFGKGGFSIGVSTARKKALTKGQIANLLAIDYSLDKEREKARDIFIFQYLSNGMNILDVCKLKQSDLDIAENYLTFCRTKTKGTRKNGKLIRVFLRPESLNIIEKWGNKDRDMDDYVFPTLNALKGRKVSTKDERYLTTLLTKTLNKYLKRIGVEQQLPFDLTTGISRHSYASVLKTAGSPILHISDGMGHESSRTTQIYLDSVDDDTVKDMSDKLL